MTPIEIIAAVGASIVLIKITLVVLAEREMKSFAKLAINSVPFLRWAYLALAIFLGYYLVQQIGIVTLFAAGLVGALAFDFIILNYKKTINTMLTEAFQTKDTIGYLLWAALAVWVLKEIFL